MDINNLGMPLQTQVAAQLAAGFCLVVRLGDYIVSDLNCASLLPLTWCL